jgi:ribosome-associated protein
MSAIEIVAVSTDVIQLDQLLKWMGLTETGGQARFLIDAGKVQVNGQTVKERRKKIYPGDCVMIDGQEYRVLRDTE